MSLDSWSTAAANTALDAQLTAYSWFQFHTGAPGAAGTANVAGNTTRKQIPMAAATGGTKTSNADVTWLAVPTSEQYTHVTQWTTVTAGSFGGGGAITANAVTAGDNFTLASGAVVMSLPVQS